MAIPGKEIFRHDDNYGPIQVFDDGNKRYLAFGNDDEQSCLLKKAPTHLQHEYSKAMLLPLIFEGNHTTANNKHILLLGLGAGSLANCLLGLLANHTVTAVELRQAVIDIAYQYFELTTSQRLKLVIADANHYIKDDQQQYRLIFSDIYSAQGVDSAQIQTSYLADCLKRLTPDGWLVLNFWREHRSDDQLLDFLKAHCQDIRMITTLSGNWIILASRQRNTLSRKQLASNAKQLSEQLGFSLLASLKKIHVVNT